MRLDLYTLTPMSQGISYTHEQPGSPTRLSSEKEINLDVKDNRSETIYS